MEAQSYSRLIRAVVVSALAVRILASTQSTPNIPQQYKRLFFQFADRRSLFEKALNSIGLARFPVGRSYALIAGVTQYPNFQPLDRSLKPAEVDMEKLKSYLKDQEFFDEIVVLKDGDMTLDNLNLFLENYLPYQLERSPHSRFLFAYSGHGYADASPEGVRGFLLLSSATSFKDPMNRIDLASVRQLLVPDIDSAEKVLVLINACQSGAFLGRKSFGDTNPLAPGDRGAHAIMASRSSQSSLHLDDVGPGSVFFEKIFAGLEGVADNAPRDGVVTYHELDTYLRREIPYVTNNNQTPMEGDISRNGSEGEFYFLNRSRQVQLGNAKPWNPGNAVTFGVQASDELERGRVAGRARKFEEAFQAFSRAAESGNPEGMNNLGFLYDEGRGVRQDYQQARQWYEKAEAAGDANAMANLGYLYEHGRGVRQDYQQARQWFEKGAAAGNAIAMNNLGFLYDEGRGVRQDYQQARQWYEKAAAAGSADAMNNLGFLYGLGRGVRQDYQQARQWYEKGAAAGNANAMNSLATFYNAGLGIAQDYEQAREWYKKAAAAGSTEAMNNLGVLYEHGGEGVMQDYQQARQWYEKAAAAGNALAMYNLGELYHYGHGVQKDDQQARQWYEKAAAAGIKEAEERLKTLPQ